MTVAILKALAVTAELTGTELSANAMRVMESDLSAYPEAAVLCALDRCRRELTGRMTLAAIIERLNAYDGRPSADEAWASALDAVDEAATVVWTEEAQRAFAIARPVLDAGDKVGARMAFRDAYDRIVRESRESGVALAWSVSLGWDKGRRVTALQHAESVGRLSHQTVAGLLPMMDGGAVGAALFGGALPAPKDAAPDVASRIAELKKIIRSGSHCQ